MSFLCIFQEEIIDLLNENSSISTARSRSVSPDNVRTIQNSSNVLIKDLGKRGIVLTGIKEEKILSLDMILE